MSMQPVSTCILFLPFLALRESEANLQFRPLLDVIGGLRGMVFIRLFFLSENFRLAERERECVVAFPELIFVEEGKGV